MFDLAIPEKCKAEFTWLVVTSQDSLLPKDGLLFQKWPGIVMVWNRTRNREPRIWCPIHYRPCAPCHRDKWLSVDVECDDKPYITHWLLQWTELLINSADEDIDSKFPTNIVVYSDGTCSWVPLGLYISSCPIDITWFPFDDQNCTMKFGSWTYDGSKINLTAKYDSIDINTYKQNGEWKLLGMKRRCPAITPTSIYSFNGTAMRTAASTVVTS